MTRKTKIVFVRKENRLVNTNGSLVLRYNLIPSFINRKKAVTNGNHVCFVILS